MLYWITRFLAFLFLKIICRLEVEGKRNLPCAGGFILASNHVSYLDPVALAAACPRQLNFMARHNLFTIPIFGGFIRRVGAFPLRRNFADIASIKEALRRLRQAGGLVLFPEGRRSVEGLSQDVHPGIGFMAAKSNAPVVPAFINGTQRALGRQARFIRPTKVKVYFGKPIYYNDSGLTNNYEDFANRVMQAIRRLSE